MPLMFFCIREYESGWEHIADELRRHDLRIHLLLMIHQAQQPDNPFEPFKGLVLSEEEVYRLLNDSPPAIQNNPTVKAITEQLIKLDESIKKRVALSAKKGVFLPLAYLSDIFKLSSFEEQCIVICLAFELDRKYEKLYAYLQDDVTSKNPTVDLAMKMLCSTPEERLAARLSFAPGERLSKYFLKKEADAGSRISLLSSVLKLDERILRFLLDSEQIDEVISAFTEIVLPDEALAPLLLGQGVQEKLLKFAEVSFGKDSQEKSNVMFYLHGPFGSGKKLQVKHFCRYFSRPLMIVDLRRMGGAAQPFGDLMERVVREAILHQAVIGFQNFHVLFEEEQSHKSLKELFEAVRIFPGIVFLLADCFYKPIEFEKEHFFVYIEFNIPHDIERKGLWEHFGKGCSFGHEIDWGTLASKFHFTPGQIQNAIATAKNMASWHLSENGQIEIDVLYKACYAQVHHGLGKKAARIHPKYGWEDIILPDDQKNQLRNACNQMKYRPIVYGEWGFERKLSYGKGLCVLFSGPPGTGKTMAAQVVAKELYLELYKIDLAQVVSKYIGETEKNLQQIFREAQQSNAILFFDETDALFGKRSEVKDSHDRYANIETAFLLQKIEEYEGITVLATNFIQNIDDAFMRRFNFIIDFPFPDARYREKIWESMFPEETPLSKDIDFEFIANKFEVAGGNIKNIAVSAAFLAAEASEPVGMKHIILAAKYELHKIGKVLLKEELGEYWDVVNG